MTRFVSFGIFGLSAAPGKQQGSSGEQIAGTSIYRHKTLVENNAHGFKV
jgi:hypothetical protein